MRHTSVSKSPTFTGQVREVFHQDTPTQGRRLAAHLIEPLPACHIPEIARLGQTLRKWKDALDAYFDTAGASNAPHRSHQQNHRTRQTHRQRLLQPHQLPTPNAPHHRRPRCLHPHSTMKTPLIHRQYRKHCSVSQGLDRLTTSSNSNYNQQHYKLCNSLERLERTSKPPLKQS